MGVRHYRTATCSVQNNTVIGISAPRRSAAWGTFSSIYLRGAICCALLIPSILWAACIAGKPTDWIASATALSMPIKPRDCETVTQTPPDLSWPENGTGPYRVEIVGPGGQRHQSDTARNWLLMPATLPPGDYRWRVIPVQPGARPSEWRRFDIASDAVPFVVPAEHDLLLKVEGGERPRAYPRSQELQDMLGALKSSRAANWNALLNEVNREFGAPVTDGDTNPAVAEGERRTYATALAANKRDASRDLNRMVRTAFVWKVTGDPKYLSESRRLLMAVASWNARGATGVNHHQVAGQTVWSLALVRDWLDKDLGPEAKRAVFAAVAVRMEDLLKEFGIAERRKLDKMPFNSHAWVALGEMAAASSLLLGDDPRAEFWFQETVRPFLFLYSPWGGHDGGFGNGMAYGIYDQLALTTPLDILRLATGVNPYHKAWARNITTSLAYFMPPGSPTVQFGDGAEKLGFGSEVGDVASAIAQRYPTPLSLWYGRQWPLQKPGALIHVFAPVPATGGAQIAPPSLVPALHMEGVGWVSMHSSLIDRARTSLYFRSSPYGSFNHSHADQNSFVLNVRGRRLAVDSGYYDYRGSPHGNSWYTLTRAHNAITYDEGRGQSANDGAATGRITAFLHSADFDIVTGDATPAYKGVLSTAVRSMVYVRPNIVVVYDVLAAAEPHIWEWNLHSTMRFREIGPGAVRVDVEDTALCASLLEPKETVFTQSDVFAAVPQSAREDGKETFVKQWHGMFKTSLGTTSSRFIAVLRIDCDQTPVHVSGRGPNSFEVSVGATRFYFMEDGQIRSVGN